MDNCGVPSDLSRIINDAVLLRLAGEKTFRRGQDYHLHGHVEAVEGDDHTIRACVRGQQEYSVTLTAEEGVLDYSCDCPVGADGLFCKHCVAAALAWSCSQDRAKRRQKAKRSHRAPQVTLADARKALLTQEKSAIVENLMEWAATDSRLRERLLIYAAQKAGTETELAAVEQTLRRAIHVPGFVEYRQMGAYVRRIDDAIDLIEKLLERGTPAAVIKLCEIGLQLLVGSLGHVDDSNGLMRGLLDRLEDIHYRASLEARPDPAALAKRLLDWQLRCEYDVFFDAVKRYAEILGPEGMRVYRTLAEAEWTKVPVRTSPERTAGTFFRITHVMEELARLSGDVEQLISVMSRDLSHAFNYLRIAEEYQKARCADKALDWAERGLKAFPDRTDSRLRQFAAEHYSQQNRHDEALSLIWQEFLERRGVDAYRTLEKYAKKAGAWSQWREQALAEVRKCSEPAVKGSRPTRAPWRWHAAVGHSELVEILLYEGDLESAWLEAQNGGCSSTLWLRLAAARERDHPDEAANVYLRQADIAICNATDSRYEDAVELVIKAATLMKRAGRSHEFALSLESLRTKFRAKRNLQKLLEEKKRLLVTLDS